MLTLTDQSGTADDNPKQTIISRSHNETPLFTVELQILNLWCPSLLFIVAPDESMAIIKIDRLMQSYIS